MVSGSVLGAPQVFQKYLETVVRSLFVGEGIFMIYDLELFLSFFFFFITEDILVNARKEAHISNPNSNLFLELDLWIPGLNICFEFQVPSFLFSSRICLLQY